MGPCAFCGAPAAFGFDPRLAGLHSGGRVIWACDEHRAGLPGRQRGRETMDIMQDFLEDEEEDLRAAAGALARFLKVNGLGAEVRAIGPGLALEGARVLLGTYFELRSDRLRAEYDESSRNVPF